ncbi:hypothetical protein KY338_01665 [Candidatus Woesearchaeota archaeon]|nr:hypothetical protein [Candidatus Woesearchaeota archaeon]MBW3005620.1 hypothetical protein [Candidatus Woesearchaeota archaeon]
MKSLREIVLIAMLTAACTGCKTKDSFIEPFVPVPIGIYVTEEGEQTEAGKRQEMLERIIQEYDVPHVADIIYYDEINHERYYQVMHTTYGVSRKSADIPWKKVGEVKGKYGAVTIIRQNQVGQGKPSVMIVPATIFEKHQDKQDLVSFVVDHEGVHARDNATGLTLNGEKVTIAQVGKQLYHDILELRAYNNQMLQIEQGRDVSQECMTLIANAYYHHHQRILVSAINGNEHAQAALNFATYAPVIDLDQKKVLLIRKKEFLKKSH